MIIDTIYFHSISQKVAINSDWARKTMGQLEKADEHIARHSRRRGRKRT